MRSLINEEGSLIDDEDSLINDEESLINEEAGGSSPRKRHAMRVDEVVQHGTRRATSKVRRARLTHRLACDSSAPDRS
jgi:hypothetical protein